MMRWMAGLAVFFFSATPAPAQVATLEPAEPAWGQELTIRYDPAAEGARFGEQDAVHAVCWLYHPDGSDTLWAPMEYEDDAFVLAVPIGENTGYVTCHFVTPVDWDDGVRVETMVYRPDGEPARGALQRTISPNDLEKPFRKEIELYPDNYAAYRDYWFFKKIVDPESDKLVRRGVEEMEAIDGPRPPGMLYALATGHMMLKQEAAARAYVLEAFERFPESDYTKQMLSFYEYQVFAQQLAGEGPEAVKKSIPPLAAEHPASPIAREKLWGLAYDKEVPLEVVERIHDSWVADEPDHPMPHFAMALALLQRETDPARGADSAWDAADLILQGKLRFYDDVGGSMSEHLLPEAYKTAARLHKLAGEYGRGLAAARAAHQLAEQRPGGAHRVEGELWEAIGDRERAETAYLRAWQLEPEETEEHLKRLYLAGHDDESGFVSWVEARIDALEPDEEPQPAPAFEVTTIEGERFDLEALRGRVVVLNFWSRGCAPCIVEMPSLNKLVEEFADRPVTFLALGLDSAKSIKEFLKQKDFDYEQVAASHEVHDLFGVKGYPTHIVLDREGRTRHVLTGGSKKVDEELRPLIERLVR